MPQETDEQSFNFTLTIVAVKMKVKFPCKMLIEQSGKPLTHQVQYNQEGKFMFNQEVRLQEQASKLFTQLNICLITEKGARYISGIAKIYHNELLRSEGERVVITLSKCLDNQAFCELRVDRVVREAGLRRRTLTTLPDRNARVMSPRQNEETNHAGMDFRSPKKVDPYPIGYDTRSESHFPVTNNIKSGRLDEGRDSMGLVGHGQGYRKGNVSPKGKVRQATSKGKYLPIDFGQGDYEREKAMQAEVYKQNYHKLKQKYLKQTQTSKSEMSKRMMLENNQNNYKLEVVKLKIRTEELEKSIAQKNSRLKELSVAYASIQGRQSEINLLREDLSNKENAILIMDDTIVSLSTQNDQLRNSTKDITYSLEEKIIMLENQLDSRSSKASTRKEELQRQLKNLKQTLHQKQVELQRKNDMLQKEKNNVKDLQRTLQNKLFQFDAHIQSQRNACRLKLEQSKVKIQQVHHSLSKANLDKNELNGQIEKYKGLLLKNQYEFKLYQQEMNSLKVELQEVRPFRDKNMDILKELRVISQQKMLIEKTHQHYIVSKDNTLEELANQYKRESDYHKKTIRQLQQKLKLISSKLIESQTHLQSTKTIIEKSKRVNDSLSKELTQSRQKEKSMRKGLKTREEESDDLRKEFQKLKEKYQTMLQSTKLQLGRNRQEISKLSIDLDSESAKYEQAIETNSSMQMQLARLKMSHQFSDQKYEKMIQSSQDKYHQFEKIIREHESVIELLQEKVKSQKEHQKNYLGKLQKCDYEITMVVDKNDRIVKELKGLQQRNRQLETNLKAKQVQLVQSMRKINQTEARVYGADDKAKELKDQLQFSQSDLQRTKRVLQIVQRDFEKSKSELLTYCSRLSEGDKESQQKSQQIKRSQEMIQSLEAKNNSINKQYEKFKDSVSEALQNSFAQVIQTFSMDKAETVKTSLFGSPQFQTTSQRRGIADLSSDLVSVINNAGRQSKSQAVRLNERVKSLERDLLMVRGEMERNQETSRRQLGEKLNLIQRLQQGLRSERSEKGEHEIETHVHIEQLQMQLKHYQGESELLQSCKNELQFTVKSLRLQLDRLGEQYEGKCYQLMSQKRQLQDKLDYQVNKIEHVEKGVHQLEVEMMNINQILILEKEQNYKKDLRITQFEEERTTLNNELGVIKRKLKESEQRYSEIQIQFGTVRELKQKYETMLSDEENKLKDLRVFNNNILKEKEEIIRKQIDKNNQISSLQDIIADLRHELQQTEDMKNKYKVDLDQVKQNSKRVTAQFKDLEGSFIQEIQKYNDIREKLREKEVRGVQLSEELDLLKKRADDNQLKNRGVSEELKEENEMLSKQLQTITAQSTDSIRTLEVQLCKALKEVQTGHEDLAELEQALFVERQNNSSMHESISKLRQQLQEVRKKLQDMQTTYSELLEENRQKDEQMFEMGGRLYQFEGRMREQEEQKQREIEQMSHNYNIKYDEDCQEINQKVELIQKQKDYFKEKYNEKEQQVLKKIEELKHKEIEQAQLKKMFEEKVRRMQEEKLSLFSDKNREITKVMEENSSQFQALRQKDNQLRRVVHELDISRNSIQKSQAKMREMVSERSSQVMAYQGQIEQLRKREQLFKAYKDNVKSSQWNCQREVRKLIQAFVKRILENGDKQERHQSLISSIRGMEDGMLTAIASVGKD